MFLSFNHRTANEAWSQAAKCFRETGSAMSQTSRAGETLELLHVGISLTEPTQRWVVARHPPLNPAFALAEVIWIMAGREDAAFLTYFNSSLPKFAGATPTFPGAYGFRLRQHFRFDQLTNAYQAFKHNPSTRQVVLQIWDAEKDLPNSIGAPRSADIPCNIVSILKLREGKLEWLQIMRSNDLMLGLPYNLVQFTTLQEVMAGWLDVRVGSYNHVSDSLHLYTASNDWLNSTDDIKPELNSDSLALPKEDSEAAFAELSRLTERIIDSQTSAEHIVTLLRKATVPAAYKNIARVLCAEGARKRGRLDSAREVMGECSNPIFLQLWRRWVERVGAQSSQLVSR